MTQQNIFLWKPNNAVLKGILQKKIDSLNPSKHRWVAVSRDLEELGYTMGTKILVTGAGDLDGVWTVEDRMNKRWECRIDFLVNNDRIYGKWENVKITKL